MAGKTKLSFPFFEGRVLIERLMSRGGDALRRSLRAGLEQVPLFGSSNVIDGRGFSWVVVGSGGGDGSCCFLLSVLLLEGALSAVKTPMLVELFKSGAEVWVAVYGGGGDDDGSCCCC